MRYFFLQQANIGSYGISGPSVHISMQMSFILRLFYFEAGGRVTRYKTMADE